MRAPKRLNVCPKCDKPIRDTGQPTGICEHGRTLELDCKHCGAKLDGIEYRCEPPLILWTAVLTPEEEDRLHFDAYGPEIGPEICRREGCVHKRVAFSVLCQRHHYEMIERKPCPW